LEITILQPTKNPAGSTFDNKFPDGRPFLLWINDIWFTLYAGNKGGTFNRILKVSEFINQTRLLCLLTGKYPSVCNDFDIFTWNISSQGNSFNKLAVNIVDNPLNQGFFIIL